MAAGTQTPIAFEIVGSRPPGGAHYSDASASFRFEGLPPGFLVTSCQRYADPTIPARGSSWGGIKASYR